MRKTYAPNAVIIGTLLGILVTFKVNIVLGIIVGLAVSIVGWVLIAAFERGVYHVGDKVDDAIRQKIDEKRGRK